MKNVQKTAKWTSIEDIPVLKGIQDVQGFEEDYENTLQIGPSVSREELLEEFERVKELARPAEASR